MAAACLVGAVALVLSGHGGPVSLMGGFTSHLDLDGGALKGLEAAASIYPSRARMGGYADAAPRVPRVLAAQIDRSRQAAAKQQMLADFDRKARKQMAKDGMKTQDYGFLTDAAGTL